LPAENYKKLLDLGIIAPVDIIMERNPYLKNREDALAFLVQLQEEQRALSESRI
jgi:hypothetical protein